MWSDIAGGFVLGFFGGRDFAQPQGLKTMKSTVKHFIVRFCTFFDCIKSSLIFSLHCI